MKIFGISDLHLPGNTGKSMDRFGDNWVNHSSKIKVNWEEKINSDDLVLIPGDLSWSMNWEGAKNDIEFLSSLPGHKIIVKGNHDYFLSSNHKCKKWFKDYDNSISLIKFIYNDSIKIENTKFGTIGIFGTRGWNLSSYEDDTSNTKKLCDRELNRLKISYETLDRDSIDLCIAMFHYPPTNRYFSNRIEEKPKDTELTYQEKYDDRFFDFVISKEVDIVVFGHVHNMDLPNKKMIDNIDLYCLSADIINFDPIRIY